MMVTSAVLTGSAALIAMAAQSGIALVINGFAVYAMRQVMRERTPIASPTAPASLRTSQPFSAARSTYRRGSSSSSTPSSG